MLKLCILAFIVQPIICIIQWINSTVDINFHTSSHQTKGHLSKRIRLMISDAALVVQETANIERKTLMEGKGDQRHEVSEPWWHKQYSWLATFGCPDSLCSVALGLHPSLRLSVLKQPFRAPLESIGAAGSLCGESRQGSHNQHNQCIFQEYPAVCALQHTASLMDHWLFLK